jgi:uncharacterized membrane protein
MNMGMAIVLGVYGVFLLSWVLLVACVVVSVIFLVKITRKMNNVVEKLDELKKALEEKKKEEGEVMSD